jgi:hypothetical protein
MHNTHKKFIHDTYSTVIVVSLNHSLFNNFTTTLTFWYQVTILTVLELTFCIAMQVEGWWDMVLQEGVPGHLSQTIPRLYYSASKSCLLGTLGWVCWIFSSVLHGITAQVDAFS